MLKWKIILILAVTALGVFLSVPPDKKIKRGLDLKGGIYLVCRVVTDDAINSDLADLELRITQGLQSKKIPFAGTKPFGDPEHGTFELRVFGVPGDSVPDFTAFLKTFADFRLERRGGSDWALIVPAQRIDYIRNEAVDQTVRTIKNRIDKLGVAEPIVQRQGLTGDRILVQLPGLDDPERVKALISAVGSLELKLVEGGPFRSRVEALRQYGGTEDNLPINLELVAGQSTDQFGVVATNWYVVERLPIVRGMDIKHASEGSDQVGGATVEFSLEATGSRRFGEVTGRNIGRHLAIILENKVESAPVIRDRITSNGQISNIENPQEARDLVTVLNAGAHPAGIEYIYESHVGPSLGRDSVRSGVTAAAVGFLAVVLFMVIYYKWSGVNAIVALLLNIILLTGTMGFLGSVLTVPGIAGLILAIGMSVDANVLVFERIREDLRDGKTVKSAIEHGFSKAFGTIFDSNATTVVAAIVLFIYGTGPIRGFAITLTFGLIANMFTAVFVSKTIFEAFILNRKGRVEHLSI